MLGAAQRDILVKKFINALSALKEKPNEKMTQFKVEDVLNCAFAMGRAQVEFSQEERGLIASLVKDVIEPLDCVIFSIGYSFEHNEALRDLVMRSGLQFMIDNMSSFPVSSDADGETLSKTFERLQESKSSLDEALMRWKEGGVTLCESDITFFREEITRPKGVPNTHTWWYD